MALNEGERQASRPILFLSRMYGGNQVGTEAQESSEALERGGRFAWRLEYTLLIGVALMLTFFALAFFYFSSDISNLKSYGYVGLFLVNVIGAASILLPSPAAASVLGGGALLDDFLGVPAFVWVGLIAGLGEAVGEFSGYAAGYGGRIMVENRPEYRRIHRWMDSHGTITMFLMSTIPNPLFDVAGLAAGAVQMPMKRFFAAVLAGKVIKDTWMA
ncbi:MAG TPA: VTT domain-containing protein, partial [Dehalococcoidia bacterium]|nr:VTT domain-containing protein [Dehalococcoidia bacterium]